MYIYIYINFQFFSFVQKGKPVAPTILQRRTAAEKERILAERIAEILMEYKDFTQRSQEELTNNIKEKIVLKNQLLQQLHQTVTIFYFLYN